MTTDDSNSLFRQFIAASRLVRRIAALPARGWLVLAVLLAGVLWLPPHVALAQMQPDPRWALFVQTKDGLISNDVSAIAATDGAIWFGTGEGISRFDGTWTSFPSAPAAEDQSTLDNHAPPGRVQVLMESAANGNLYAATDQGWIAEWRDDAWHAVVNVGLTVFSLTEVRDELWIGTNAGLLFYDGDKITQDPTLAGQPVFAFSTHGNAVWVGADSGLWRFDSRGWQQIEADGDLLADGVTALARDPAGSLWVGTRYGFAWQDPVTHAWRLVETPDDLGIPAPVQSLAVDSYGTLWAATDGAGAVSIGADGTPRTYGLAGDQSLTTRFVRAAAVDQDGTIWFATPAGAYRYQVSSWWNDVRGTGADDLINHVNGLLVDRAGNLWIATGGNGVRVRSAFSDTETVYVDELGSQAAVLTLEEDAQGGIWAGSFDGVFRFDQGAWSVPVDSADLPSPVVTDLLAEGDTVWIATDSGLANYNLTTGTLTTIPAMDRQSVEALALDNLGQLWAGTRQDGITIRSLDGRWTHLRHDPADPASLPADQVNGSGLAPDLGRPGGMWVLFVNEGLMHWDGERWLPGDPGNELPSNLLWAVYTDPEDGSLWVGSEAGVSRFDGTTWGTLGAKDGLQSAIVYAIVRAPDGSYWFGGRRGLSHHRPESSPPWIRIDSLVGAKPGAGGVPELELGQDLLVNFEAGDLQTLQANLMVLYRVVGEQATPWREVPPGFLRVSPDVAGDYTLEFWARDQSFNYSDKAYQSFAVVPPPPRVHLPLLGDVEKEVFQTLLVLGSVALLGAGYVSLEIVQNRRRMREAVNRAYNPYISGEPIRREDMFFGRYDLVQRIVDTLHNNSIMIHGERRIGKTSLLYHLANVLREVQDSEYWFVPFYLDLEGTTQETFFHFLTEEMANDLYYQPALGETIAPLLAELRYHSVDASEYTDRDFSRDLREIVQALQAYADEHYPDKQLRLILLMDEMDVVNNYDHLVQQQLRRIFMRDFATNLGAVVAGIQISKTWDRVESPWYNLFNEIKLEPFTREQALELLTQPVRGYYAYDQAALEFIIEKSEGRPFRIQQYGLEAVNHMLAEGRRRIRLEDAEAAHQAIQSNAHGQEVLPFQGDRHNGEFVAARATSSADAQEDAATPADSASGGLP